MSRAHGGSPHAVVATGSVKDAAARLGYTPSAISQRITALERETSPCCWSWPDEGSGHRGRTAARRSRRQCAKPSGRGRSSARR